MNNTRKGSALLEVLAAMAILMISGVAGASLLAEVAHATAQAESTEAQVSAASAVLARVSLHTRNELLASVGARNQSGFIVNTQEVTSVLFDVRVLQASNGAIILETIFYRAEDERQP